MTRVAPCLVMLVFVVVACTDRSNERTHAADDARVDAAEPSSGGDAAAGPEDARDAAAPRDASDGAEEDAEEDAEQDGQARPDADARQDSTTTEDAAVEDAAVADAEDVESDAGGDPARPTTPTPCDDINRGACACNESDGFTTHTWWVADQQRCMTTYVPADADAPLPLLISNNCYSANQLGECASNSAMVQAATRFGFVGVCTTSADGNWTFGNDGVVNDERPAPCAAEDSKDIRYMQGVFGVIDALAADGVVDSERVFAWGFSQNAMFTAWMAVCHPERIARIWQGGSGLYVDGVTDPLPQMEGACRRSDFLEHGRDCAEVAPCEDCQYFPVYPQPSSPPLDACIMAYRDDFLFDTAAPMAERMIREGHEADLLHFADIGRGHSNPLNPWDWMVGCMGVTAPCSAACAERVVECVDGESPEARSAAFDRCVAGEIDTCAEGCAPTLSMLRTIEQPCLVDGACDASESSETCPEDCGGADEEQLPSCEEQGREELCCGDALCDGPETPANCIRDCA